MNTPLTVPRCQHNSVRCRERTRRTLSPASTVSSQEETSAYSDGITWQRSKSSDARLNCAKCAKILRIRVTLWRVLLSVLLANACKVYLNTCMYAGSHWEAI